MREYFEGYYYKQQGKGGMLALIPGKTKDHAFIQVVTEDRPYHAEFPVDQYRINKNGLYLDHNIFSDTGITLNINQKDLQLSGTLRYFDLTPIKGDIMGPFQFFPMECRHGVISMNHKVDGTLLLNGKTLDFTNGKGYIETDSGCSFPEKYTWMQCNDFEKRGSSIMVSVARIPFLGCKFWGCICVVRIHGKEYRLATYKGVKIIRCEMGYIELVQGKYRLKAAVKAQGGMKLAAPKNGDMSRTIQESLSCPAHFRFYEGNEILFDGFGRASYEYAME